MEFSVRYHLTIWKQPCDLEEVLEGYGGYVKLFKTLVYIHLKQFG